MKDQRKIMNERDYPIPAYAVYVWLVGDKLHVTFPPTLGTKSHTVIFPANEKGMELFLSTMRERKPGQFTIGTRAEPTSYQVERALAGDKKYKDFVKREQDTREQQQILEDMLKEIGYDFN